ncbi:LicD family protein [Psychrobacter sanguinis]|uniref:LicD/FKTN/FKRP nucleotidyltransferase domain-containing protein n=1 Tax=Psychrobacter sanguinis TaxID=861445 RepID=A0A844LZC3_9GAMM|nr:LicD family protein [Psychrobacter sanguinis]MUG31587.1 hypothetical protein [Psychrobacter sanguinis]
MPKNNDIIKENLLQTMSYFHSFCTTYNLEYSLIGGSLLGAVRHQGFIPWDDDIDIVMPRSDYDRLKQLQSQISAPYELLDSSKDPNYIYPFIKMTNSKLIVQESFYKPFTSGVWIDIFPLDYTFSNKSLQRKHFFVVDIFRKALILKHGAFKLSKRSNLMTNFLKKTYPIAALIPSSFFSFAFYQLESIPYKYLGQKQNLANLYGTWKELEVAPKSLFNERKLYKFENHHFWGIKNADFWLSKVYGNYMELPPEHKRTTHIGHIVSNK